MKKTIAITAAFLLSCSAMSMVSNAAETEQTSVYVTISDSEGKLAAVQEKIDVTISTTTALLLSTTHFI